MISSIGINYRRSSSGNSGPSQSRRDQWRSTLVFGFSFFYFVFLRNLIFPHCLELCVGDKTRRRALPARNERKNGLALLHSSTMTPLGREREMMLSTITNPVDATERREASSRSPRARLMELGITLFRYISPRPVEARQQRAELTRCVSLTRLSRLNFSGR